MQKRRVVITGMGIISPVGNSIAGAWENILAGRSGIRTLETFDTELFSTRFAGTIKDFDPDSYDIGSKDRKKMDDFMLYGLAAAIEAMRDSGLTITDEMAPRVGAMIGSGIGGLGVIQKNYDAFLKGGPRKISPFFIPSAIINLTAGHLAIRYNLKGPNLTVSTACTTGAHAIGMAARLIAYGDADIMLAGGSESASTELGLGGFAAARALSTRNDDPQTASRPWDLNRDGFVLGDGAGVLVMESLEHAQARGAKIYAELAGFGMSCDAYHITQPSAEGPATAMQNAIRDAGIKNTDIHYINAHGTSTPIGDLNETKAIMSCFGEKTTVPISSTKSMTGHLLGAAGAVEAIFSILALRDQIIPPTINLETPDPECPLDYVPNVARPAKLTYAMSNSFGFGGTNGTLIFKRFET